MINVKRHVVRSLMVNCIKSNSIEFLEGTEYLADMDVTGQWSVTDMWGVKYDLDRSMWGRLIFKAGGKHFRFEPNDD